MTANGTPDRAPRRVALCDASGFIAEIIQLEHWQQPDHAGHPWGVFRVHPIPDGEFTPEIMRFDRDQGVWQTDTARETTFGHRHMLASLRDPEFMVRLVLGDAALRSKVQAALAWKDGSAVDEGV